MKDTLSGNTGKPIQDGTVRGAFVAAVMGVLAFVADRTDALSDGDLVNLLPAVVFLSYFGWALFDRARMN